MQNLKFILFSFLMLLLITGCQTIKDKTDAIVEKENEKLSKYISKPASVLQMDLGKPDEDFKNVKGNFELIYNTKKYGIPCERRFEINSDNIVIGLYLTVVFRKILARKNPRKQGLTYLISISFFFLCSGIILSQDIVKRPSFNAAPFTFTSSAIVNDLANCL